MMGGYIFWCPLPPQHFNFQPLKIRFRFSERLNFYFLSFVMLQLQYFTTTTSTTRVQYCTPVPHAHHCFKNSNLLVQTFVTNRTTGRTMVFSS